MRSSKGPARAAILFGALAIAALPAAVLVARQTTYRLLETLYVAVPVSVVLGVLAVALARRARLALQQSLQPERRKLVRWARIVAWAGAYVGITGALALAVYGALRYAQG